VTFRASNFVFINLPFVFDVDCSEYPINSFASKAYQSGRIHAMRISDKLREQIEEKIATGEFAPGSSLDEATLVEQYGVSRTPIREALIQLAAEGLIEIRPRRGAIVTSIGPTRLIEMFEVMAELEAMCGQLAARRMTDAERQELTTSHLACEDARANQDSDQYFYCNERFHAAIYAGSHNSFLREQANQLHRRLRPYRRLQLRVRDRMSVSYKEHHAIVNAITSGDAEAAALALREHVVVQGARFGDLLSSLSDLAQAA
jgi:DNA-binding GntR family transcriptional regulator